MNPVKKFLLVFPLLLVGAAAFAREITREWLEENYVKTETYITMRDGIRLHTAVYEPKDADPHPLILLRTPYGLAPYGEKISGTLTGISSSSRASAGPT